MVKYTGRVPYHWLQNYSTSLESWFHHCQYFHENLRIYNTTHISSLHSTNNINIRKYRLLKNYKIINTLILSHSVIIFALAIMKTSIIISELDRNDFIKTLNLSLADRLKLDVLNHNNGSPDVFLNEITNWSNLPFLNRIVILVSSELIATQLYDFLLEKKQSYLSHTKISLQENLLQRSKSYDGTEEELSTKDLRKFKMQNTPAEIENYSEPKPHKIQTPKAVNKTRTLFKPELSIDTGVEKSSSVPSPTITLNSE